MLKRENTHTYVMGNDFDYMKLSYQDIVKHTDSTYLTCKIKSRILERVSRLYASNKLSQRLHLPARRYIYQQVLKAWLPEMQTPDLFLFYQVNRFSRDPQFIQFLRKLYPQSKFVFFYTNISWRDKSTEVEQLKQLYDLVYTFDELEAKNYGINYHDNVYTQLPHLENLPVTIDVLFIGYDKGRLQTLLDLYEVLTQQGFHCDFTILGVDPDQRKHEDFINYSQKFTYLQTLQKVIQARCVLEVLKEGQVGSSLRLQEALIYHRKLLTTNQGLEERPYFNPDQIQVIQSIDSIDVEWIRKPLEQTTDWAAYFSPLALINDLRSKLGLDQGTAT